MNISNYSKYYIFQLITLGQMTSQENLANRIGLIEDSQKLQFNTFQQDMKKAKTPAEKQAVQDTRNAFLEKSDASIQTLLDKMIAFDKDHFGKLSDLTLHVQEHVHGPENPPVMASWTGREEDPVRIGNPKRNPDGSIQRDPITAGETSDPDVNHKPDGSGWDFSSVDLGSNEGGFNAASQADAAANAAHGAGTSGHHPFGFGLEGEGKAPITAHD